MKVLYYLRALLCVKHIQFFLHKPIAFYSFLFIFSTAQVQGQGRGQQGGSRIITGTVHSASDNQPLQGASIKLTERGGALPKTADALTDAAGKFSLQTNLPAGVISISYIGYQTQTINYGPDAPGPSIIRLLADDNTLQEVEVNTGYQIIPKERATGSFVHIDSALFNRAVSTDVISRLKGIAPSLLFDERAGGEPKLSIRGRSTIFANADPLIVVDNFPYEGDLSNLNPNDVASVSILRDAAAASIWGIRAGNGVIVITTKKGRKNQPMQVSLNSNVTIAGKPDVYAIPQISPADQIEVEEYLFKQGYYTANLGNTVTYPAIPPAVEILADKMLSESEKQARLTVLKQNDVRRDILKYFYQPKVSQQYALQIQGGGARHSYYFSGGFDKGQASLAGNGSDRINLNAQQNFELLPALSLQTGVFITQSRSTGSSGLSVFNTTAIYQRLADDQGNPLPIAYGFREAFLQEAAASGHLNWQYVPLDEQELTRQQGRGNHYRANTRLDYRILPGLNAQVQYQYERQNSHGETLYDKESYYVRNWVNRFSGMANGIVKFNLPQGAIADRNESLLDAHNGRIQLTDHRRIGPGDWDLLAGFEVREAKGSGFGSTIYGYDPQNGTSIPVNLDSGYVQYPSGWMKLSAISNQNVTGSLERFRSAFFNGSYQAYGRYALSASARMDQTNLFGVKANQRTVPLWSTGFKWDISKEPFYLPAWLPALSARLTYGYNGNFDELAVAYVTARYGVNEYGLREAVLGALPNPQLQAERTAIWNLGLDFGLRNDVLTGRIDLYRRLGKDLIASGPIDPTTGRSTFRGNLGQMKGKGLDLELQSRNLRGIFNWRTSAMLSYSKDKVTEVYEQKAISYFYDASLLGYNLFPIVGRPLYGIYSYQWAGLDPQTGDPQGLLDGQVSKDYTAMQNSIKSAHDLVYHGTAIPVLFGALRNEFDYKGFSLSVNISYKLGYYFRRSSLQNTGLLSGAALRFPDYGKRWKQPGDEAFIQVPSFRYPVVSSRNAFYEFSEILVEKGDHIRLQDVRLGYTFGRWQCYAYASNLGILWRANKQGTDPDYNLNSATGNTTLPAPRSVAVGVQTHF